MNAYSSCGTSDSGSRSITINPAVGGTIGVSPDPPNTNWEATLTATPDGGTAPYTYAWDIDNDEVPRRVGAVAKVTGVRYDLRPGRYRSIRVAKSRKSAGPAGRLPRKICS